MLGIVGEDINANSSVSLCSEISKNNIKKRVNPLIQKDSLFSTNSHELFSIRWYIDAFMKVPLLSFQMVISSVLVQFFALGMPLFYIVIFDRVFGRQNLSALNVMAVGLVLILLFDVGIKYLRSYILAHLLEFVDKISCDIYLNDIATGKTKNNNPKAHAEKFTEIFKANHAIANMICVSSLDVVFSLLVVCILVLLNAKLAFVAMLPIVPMAFLVFWKAPHQRKTHHSSFTNYRKVQYKLAEYIENRETLRSVNAHSQTLGEISVWSKEIIDEEFNSKFDKITANIDSGFVMNLGSFAILYFGAYEVLSGTISFGVYLAISIMGRNFVGGIQRLMLSIQQFYDAKETIQAYKNSINNDSYMDRVEGISLKDFKGRIDINNLSYKYQNATQYALNNINLSILPGEKVVITGNSGAGKSTLLKLLQAHYIADSGSILYDNINILDINENYLLQNISLLLQESRLFLGTIKDNIAIGGREISTEAILRVCSFVQLDKLLLSLPKGINSHVAPMGANFSGGQNTQIALARTLINNPRVILFDEAMSNMDLKQQEKIYNMIFTVFRDSTCIFVSDNPLVHKRSDKIAVLSEGEIVEIGKFEELLVNESFYYHLHTPKYSLR